MNSASEPACYTRHPWAAVAWGLLCSLAVGFNARSAIYVSFQEGNVRTGSNRDTVSTSGTLVTSSYNMPATYLRSDQATSNKNGTNLIAGTQSSANKMRTLLSFDISHLTNVVGTNFNRIDSVALILTRESIAGTGGSASYSLHLTRGFNEATATWNNPHGDSADAGGFVGTELRQRACTGTDSAPVKETFASPASAWSDSGSGPDFMVDAVRVAMTNGTRLLHLMVKRTSETAADIFCRFKQDNDTTTDFRPQLIVGVDSAGAPTNGLSGLLAAYYFNENSNSAGSLAVAAAATVIDPAHVSAANAEAGVGLGQFGAGTDTANTHGYGTGGYVSPPTGFYVRSSVTSSTVGDSLAADDYVSFTVGPRLGYAATVRSFSARVKGQGDTNMFGTVFVRSSLDHFSNDIASVSVRGTNASFAWLTNAMPANLVVEPLELRFYLFDNSDSSGEFLRLDDVLFFGDVTNLPPGVQIVTLAASDSMAMESGGDTGAFLLQRIGDTNSALAVAYATSGTASNGVDYQLLNATATFPPGATNLVIPIIPINDLRAEPNETVSVTLLPAGGYTIVGEVSASVTIIDDNDPPEFVVAAATPLAYEPAASLQGVFTITRTLGDTNAAATLHFMLSGSAAFGVDYFSSITNEVVFAPGEMTRSILITPVDDSEFESPETVVLTLLAGQGYSLDAQHSATVTIFDDEGVANGRLLVEAESFSDLGGWVVDQQFVDLVGSPYLLAHGKGKPSADATTTVSFPATGAYRLWARTKDWTAPSPYHPGAFKVIVGGIEVAPTFGTAGAGWLWQDGGMVMVTNTTTELRLHDLTGFDGRCDALFFSTDPTFVPTNSPAELARWRHIESGLPDVPPSAGEFDLVVIGGGIAGSAASIAAARQGLQVALIHDRPFPGGNASQDVRVHTLGINPGGIVGEINTPDYLIGSDEFMQSDQRRMQVLRAETNIHLFTEWRAFAVQTNGSHIVSVDAKQTHTGEERRFSAPLFIDSTGDAWIGFWAGALYRRGREARADFSESLAPITPDTMTMGTTLSWNSKDAGRPVSFPSVPWATNVSKDYVATRGDWWWEYGLLRDTIYDAEEVRDHLLQAIYGSFANAKKSPSNANRDLDWVAYIGGKRESRRLVGDHTLVETDVRNHPIWPDAVVREAREIDLHYPIGGAYDWQTYAQYTTISDYWIPFRCLYSTNIDNLMMAGRCLSATHVGLGSPRVMNTCGQMGVAVGNAAALCKKYRTNPRGVAQRMAPELQQLIRITSYFDTPSNTVAIVDNSDFTRVELTGAWTASTGLPGYYGPNFLVDGNTNKGITSIRFRPDVPMNGAYRLYLRWPVSDDRADSVPVDVISGGATNTVYLDETFGSGGWSLLGSFFFEFGNSGSVLIRTTNTYGIVAADALALVADFPINTNFVGRAWQDDDGDGVFNYVEYLNGTNPSDSSSVVRLRFVTDGSGAILRFPAMQGRPYTVEYSDALGSPWQILVSLPRAPYTREIEISDPTPPAGNRFYRLTSP